MFLQRHELLGDRARSFLRQVDFHVDLPPYSSEPHLNLKFGRHVTISAGIVVKTPLA
jgi:hypothetical protein